MAVAFKNVKYKDIDTSAVAIGTYAVPAATTAVVTSLIVGNTTSGTIVVEVSVWDGAYHFLAKGAEILAGGSLVVIGDDRLVLNTGEKVYVKSDTATSCDAVMSLMEYT
jgi:predicted ribosome-associated RNA-binding protein Tma20